MEQRRFGTSELSVSASSFGTMTIDGRDRLGKMGNPGVAGDVAQHPRLRGEPAPPCAPTGSTLSWWRRARSAISAARIIFALAGDEGPAGVRETQPHALRLPAGQLFADRAGLQIGE